MSTEQVEIRNEEAGPQPGRPAGADAVDRRRNAKLQSATLMVLATGAVLTLMYFAKPVLVTVLASVLISFMLAPVVDVLERLRFPKALSSLIAVLLLCGICYGITYVSYNRAVQFVQDLPQYSSKIRHVFLRFQKQAETIQRTTENVLPEDDKQTVKVKQTTSWSDTLSKSAANITEIILLIGFIPFLVYFMLSWQEHVRSATVMLFKLEHRNTAYVTLGAMSAMIRTFIVGNLVIALFMAVISTIVFGVIKLPYFYFLGAISGFLSVIPYLGVVLAIVPPVIAGMGQIGSEEIVVIIVTVISLHLFAINVLYPKVIGRRLQLNPLAVTLALLFWGWLWGAMGLILAVPLTAAMKIVFDHVDSLRPYAAWLGE
jgi:predicted PurR-regulated permease PerM